MLLVVFLVVGLELRVVGLELHKFIGYVLLLDGVFYLLFVCVESRLSCFDFEKDDLFEFTCV